MQYIKLAKSQRVIFKKINNMHKIAVCQLFYLMTKSYIPSTIKTDFVHLHTQLTAVICPLFNNVMYADCGNVWCVAKYIALVHSKMDLGELGA